MDTENEMREAQADKKGCVPRWVEILCVLAIIVVLLAILVPALRRAETGGRFTCQNNLRHFGLGFEMYAHEAEGKRFPPLSSQPGNLMFQTGETLFSDPTVAFCPDCTVKITLLDRIRCLNNARDLERVAWHKVDQIATKRGQRPEDDFKDDCYIYLGYLLTSDEQLEAFAEVYKERVKQRLGFTEDLPAPPGKGSAGGDRFLRLHEGIESELLPVEKRNDRAALDAAAKEIPVVFDRPGNHPGRYAGNVVYLNGQIATIPNGKECRFPYTERAIKALMAMDALGPPPPAH